MEQKASTPVGSQPEDVNTLTTTLSSSNVTDGGYDFELIEGTDSRYECPICLLYLRDPVLTTCGHRFCSGCISQWVIKEDGRCPVDGAPLSHENIFPDNYTRREIRQCKARCPYVKDGCNTVLPLSDLERHIQSDHLSLSEGGNSSMAGNGKTNGIVVPCLYKEIGCVSYFPTDQLQRHLEIDVHHHIQLLTAAYKRLKLFSSKPNVDCQHHMDMFSRQDSRESTCWLLAEDGSESEDYQFRRQRSWDSVRYARKYHTRSKYPDRLAESDESVCKSEHRKGKGELLSPATSVSASATTLTTYVPSDTELNMKDIFERLVRLEQNDREKQIKIERLESKLTSAVDLFSTATKLMEDLTIRYCNGIFVWKIPNFRQLCTEMRKNPNRVLNSPGFYTDTFGYKLSARINLTTPSSSSGMAEASHGPRDVPLEEDVDTFLSLYIHFMMGEFDDTLRWPFNGEMGLIVIHPSAPQQSLREVMRSKPEAAAFAKPTLKRNLKGFGYPDICSINKIFSNGFVKNNTLVCKVFAKAH